MKELLHLCLSWLLEKSITCIIYKACLEQIINNQYYSEIEAYSIIISSIFETHFYFSCLYSSVYNVGVHVWHTWLV